MATASTSLVDLDMLRWAATPSSDCYECLLAEGRIEVPELDDALVPLRRLPQLSGRLGRATAMLVAGGAGEPTEATLAAFELLQTTSGLRPTSAPSAIPVGDRRRIRTRRRAHGPSRPSPASADKPPDGTANPPVIGLLTRTFPHRRGLLAAGRRCRARPSTPRTATAPWAARPRSGGPSWWTRQALPHHLIGGSRVRPPPQPGQGGTRASCERTARTGATPSPRWRAAGSTGRVRWPADERPAPQRTDRLSRATPWPPARPFRQERP